MKELEKWVHQFSAKLEERFQSLDKVLEIEKQRLLANKENDGYEKLDTLLSNHQKQEPGT